ncbi:hypothetical protein BN1723_011539 [Verticillium longisporum]|uniref:SMC hinge domain-containing protein n=1 Tax=Verticillium longisporum TaxID=100787 RepID=A0A0G4L866_VERLO|nr:hypothetical protein BN1723_011539 [Verticillium longisporum]
MEYVFGNTLVCADAETAKKVTFDPNVRMRSITLEGDAYDPSGTLSGGSSPNSSGVLVTLQKLNELTRQLKEAESTLKNLQVTISREKSKLDHARKIKQELDLKSHEIKLAEEQIGSNSSSSIIQEVANMKETIIQLKNDMADAKKRHAEALADEKRINKDMQDFDSNKDAKLIELQKALDKLRATLSKSAASVKTVQKELQGAQLDSEQVAGDLSGAREQLQEVEVAIKAQQQDIEGLVQQQAELKDTHDSVQAELDDERAKLHGFDDELRALEEATRSKNARVAEEGLEMQTLGHQVEKFHKEQQSALQTVAPRAILVARHVQVDLDIGEAGKLPLRDELPDVAVLLLRRVGGRGHGEGRLELRKGVEAIKFETRGEDAGARELDAAARLDGVDGQGLKLRRGTGRDGGGGRPIVGAKIALGAAEAEAVVCLL